MTTINITNLNRTLKTKRLVLYFRRYIKKKETKHTQGNTCQ